MSNSEPYSKRSRILRIIGPVVVALVVGYFFFGETLKRKATLSTMEVVGNIAVRNMPDDVAGGFHQIPIELKQIDDNIYQATGISNAHLIQTSEGYVLFDSGIAIQAAQHVKLMEPIAEGPLTHIILSHSHADHIGGTKFWKQEGTEIVTHREFPEEQRYLKDLEPYMWNRNRTLFPWMPESPPTNPLVGYGGVEPTLLVDEKDYIFKQGGVEFHVLSTPGAEGADNISLWLPEKKIFFSGDFFGPLFPQFPNLFTMRGEKMRKPIEYINSLNKVIALEPALIVPSHHTPISGKENIKASMIKIRDAVQYVHDETIAGMNAGKSVYQLMKEIQLPPELALTEEHGKVSWGVRSIWEYYSTWFHFESTTELYPTPVAEIYSELSEIVGADALMDAAEARFEQNEPVKALHYIEIILASDNNHQGALNLRLEVLNKMLEAAVIGGNNYEKDYLRRRISVTEHQLGNL